MTHEQREIYEAAQHKIQSIAAYEYGQKEVSNALGKREFKHLRVGLNSFARDHASLVTLLLKKGVITQEEYDEAIVNGIVEEANWYEKNVREEYCIPDNVTFA